MTFTTKTHAGRQYADFGADTTSEALRLFRVDASQAQAVTVDIALGIAMGNTAQTRNGTARAAVVGKDLVINCDSSDRGTLIVEDSADAITWGNAVYVSVAGGHVIGLRLTPTLVNYRVSFQAASGASVSRLHVVSQVRNLNV